MIGVSRMLQIGLLAAGACGGARPHAATGPTDPLAPTTLYPMPEGAVWSYDVDTGEGVPTLAITRVVTRVGARVEVSSGSEPVPYEIRDEGIYRTANDAWLLRAPIEVGASWESAPDRRALVRSVTETVDVVGQTATGCVRVEETDSSDTGRQITTTYCPGIGPVLVEYSIFLETAARTVAVHARLRGYDLGTEREQLN